ncbi:DNA polymerase IV [Agaribacter flavus]|uniref:DNA polymerase IV n=1 Tax=Agaribacter flavus TaxID=1902781 RepID=A0ABV7FLL5_9ALTE
MKKFIHIDMDAFYVSVEIRDRPELASLPVAVGGRSRQRGVLSTCNYIARKYGVHSAMPTAIAIRKCPDLVVLPGRMSIYKEISGQIRQIFARYTPLIEPLSLDEAYLDVTDSEACNGSATLIAKEIRQAIYEELQLTASAGIAPLKFVAKIASDLNKPNGQFLVKPEEMDTFLMDLPLQKIPGVGKVSFEKLAALGWTHGRHIRNLAKHKVVEQFGKFGLSLWSKCNGIDNRKVQVSRVRKSVGVEHTFSANLKHCDQLYQYLINKLLPELKQRGRAYIDACRVDKVGVKIKFEDFVQTTKEQKHQNLDEEVFKALLHEAFLRGKGKSVRLLGIHIGVAEKNDESTQLSLTLE